MKAELVHVFESHGLRCAIRICGMGTGVIDPWYCGYVESPDNFVTPSKDSDDWLHCHGGVTFEREAPPDKSIPAIAGRTWYGFDCGHAGDNMAEQNETYVRAQCEHMAAQISTLAKQVYP